MSRNSTSTRSMPATSSARSSFAPCGPMSVSASKTADSAATSCDSVMTENWTTSPVEVMRRPVFARTSSVMAKIDTSHGPSAPAVAAITVSKDRSADPENDASCAPCNNTVPTTSLASSGALCGIVTAAKSTYAQTAVPAGQAPLSSNPTQAPPGARHGPGSPVQTPHSIGASEASEPSEVEATVIDGASRTSSTAEAQSRVPAEQDPPTLTEHTPP
mmetsp:Transcript_137829/g.334968  ORF Transcript_137829/g.334968 Transcript_137829/m.334968 type:complete len:217 (-) Transcript_137829:589-1239(-)